LPKDHPDKAAEIGSEPTPEAFIATMVAVFREVRRILRDDGVLWVNLGDGYNCGTNAGRKPSSASVGGWQQAGSRDDRRVNVKGLGAGELLNIPHRVAEALRADGWIWRQTIVWAKRCLSGGTWLYARTAKGDSPAMLKDLARLDPKTVKLWDGHKWVQVLAWSRTPTERGSRHKNGNRHYLEIVLRSGERIGCTAEHRWPTQRGVVYASDLRPGDVIKTCTLPSPSDAKPLCFSDADLGWLAGFYMAEGFATPLGVSFAIHAKEVAAYERIRRMAESFGDTASYQRHKGNSAVVVVYSKTMRALLAEIIPGSSCKNKGVGRKAWMRSNEFLSALLDGWLEGDGHWDTRIGQWRFGFTNNDGWATDLRCLCARVGRVCRLKRAVHKCKGKSFPGWRGRIRKHSTHWNAADNGEIVSIGNSRAREFWDVSVDQEPNLFALASGVLSHNSPMPESCQGWRWQRCRVKVKNGESPARNLRPELHVGPDRVAVGADGFPAPAVWSDCPGCPKCTPNGGYVLRKGSGRCTTGHEYVFVFAKTKRYFWDSAASAEAIASPERAGKLIGGNYKDVRPAEGVKCYTTPNRTVPATRNPRTVWTLSSEPSSYKHYATFPSELVRRMLAPSPCTGGVCPQCGAPFAPVVEREKNPKRDMEAQRAKAAMETGRTDGHVSGPEGLVDTTRCSGYRPSCSCGITTPAPATILDPFSGIATTGQTALALGANYIGIELNPEYAEFSRQNVLTKPRWLLRREVKATKKKRPDTTPGPLFQESHQ